MIEGCGSTFRVRRWVDDDVVDRFYSMDCLLIGEEFGLDFPGYCFGTSYGLSYGEPQSCPNPEPYVPPPCASG